MEDSQTYIDKDVFILESEVQRVLNELEDVKEDFKKRLINKKGKEFYYRLVGKYIFLIHKFFLVYKKNSEEINEEINLEEFKDIIIKDQLIEMIKKKKKSVYISYILCITYLSLETFLEFKH